MPSSALCTATLFFVCSIGRGCYHDRAFWTARLRSAGLNKPEVRSRVMRREAPSRARHCQTLDRSRIEPQTGGSNKILELILGGCARNRSCQTRTRDQPGKCNLRGRGLALGRHLVEPCQNATPTLIQVLAHALTTRALPEVSFRAVLARQKPARKGVVADHPQTVLAAERLQFGLVASAIMEVVLGLEALVTRQTSPRAYVESFSEPRGTVVRGPDRPDLSRLDQFSVGAERFLERGVRFILMGLVKVDTVGLQPLE